MTRNPLAIEMAELRQAVENIITERDRLRADNKELAIALKGFIESFDHGEHESWDRVAKARAAIAKATQP